MTDFHALDHETRCYTLVGFFLQAWALLESQISRAIARALVLNSLQEAVLQKNTKFRDKINILKTLGSLSMPSGASRLRTLLNSIYDYSHVRNMMAHDLFLPSETSDGVQFHVVKAQGSLQFPNVDWSINDFIDACSKIDGFRNEVVLLHNNLQTFNSLAAALLSPSSPNSELLGLAFPYRPDHLFPEPPSSDTDRATGHKGAQTPHIPPAEDQT